MSLLDTAKHKLDEARERFPLLDHVVRTVQHYGRVNGTIQSGAITFFGFLSVFPLLALAFAVIGYVAYVYPDAEREMVKAIRSVLPVVTTDPPEEASPARISIATFQAAAGAAAGIGAVGLLYTGLGWISAMREALLEVFEKPQREQPNFVVGKLKDLVSLIMIGLVLFVAVVVAGLISRLSEAILGFLELGTGLSWLLVLISVAVGLAANTVLFFAVFRLLGNPDLPKRPLWAGALVGAIGFELIKRLAYLLLAGTEDQPAFAVFGVALVLLVWINYFARVVIYAASWAYVSPEARAQREAQAALDERVEGPKIDVAALGRQEVAGDPAPAPSPSPAPAPAPTPPGAFARDGLPAGVPDRAQARKRLATGAAAGAVVAAALAAAVRRHR